jgi:tetratricopeptide (TPR) repeat protein
MLQKALSLEEENKAARTEVLNTKLELAKAYRAKNEFLKAENQYKDILRELDRLETPNNTMLPTVLNNLAYLLRLQDRFEEAETYYRRSLSMHIEIYGEDHPQSTMILNNLASVLHLQGKNEETENLLDHKVSLNRKRYGTHWRTGSAIGSLGMFYLKIKDYENAKVTFKLSNEMYKQVLNQYHTWTGIADVYWYICKKNLGESDIGAFKETDGFKILDYNRPYFSNYDSILVAQLLDYASEFSEADMTSETALLKDILERN